MNVDTAKLPEEFKQLYDKSPRLFRAPGRVNLIGEHTDYNEGFVLPIAINQSTYIAATKRDDNTVRVHSSTLNKSSEFNLNDDVESGDWTTYIAGLAAVLQENGFNLSGADLLLSSDVPIGAGLSSSASLEMACGLAFLSLSENEINKVALAFAGQAVEHKYVGVKSGIMDQFASMLAQRKHALLIDCRSLETEQIPLRLDDNVLVVCDTRIKHKLASSEYNIRRAECEKGVELLSAVLPDIKSLRDVSLDDFEQNKHLLNEKVLQRCRHVITENERTLKSVNALREGDLVSFGKFMYESHNSLRNDYEVSCKELDVLVEIASSIEGVKGARMTGGGFGGCTINLLQQNALVNFQNTITAKYKEAFGFEPEIYVVETSDGACELSFAHG